MSSLSVILGRRRGAFFGFLLTAAWMGGPSPAHAQNVNYGETFHRFDRNVEYVSTWFRDVKATTVRRPGNLVETIVEDADGVTLARSVASSTSLTLSATLTGDVNGAEVRAQLEPNSQYGTDWFGVQLRVLWSEDQALKRLGDRALRQLIWDGRFLKHQRAPRPAAHRRTSRSVG